MDKRLLKIISEEGSKNGFADGKTVQTRYGDGFDDAFMVLVQRGFISRSGPMGSISLTPSGHFEAER